MRPQRAVSGYNSKLREGGLNGEKCRAGEIKTVSLVCLQASQDFPADKRQASVQILI